MQSSVFVAISGGLGNQMFQYAAARGIALRNGVPLFLDTREVERDPQRAYALGGFALASEIATPEHRASLPRPLHRHLRWLPRWPGGIAYRAERGFAVDPSVITTAAPVYLVGHWQSEKYFADVADRVRGDFQLLRPLTADRQDVSGRIKDVTAVSLHVRRGDYVTNTSANAYHGTLEPEWYGRAMAEIEASVERPTYFVFSDDPDWASANLPIRSEAFFVSPSSDGHDYEDLHLMANCRHHIIANSSFSWWGAWLDPRPDKIVIAPARWFRGAGLDTTDLVPQDWLRL